MHGRFAVAVGGFDGNFRAAEDLVVVFAEAVFDELLRLLLFELGERCFLKVALQFRAVPALAAGADGNA